MSAAANWSYTAVATLWKKLDQDEYGKPTYDAPIQIMCDYGSDAKANKSAVGIEFVVKDTIWTEYALAQLGDFVLIGSSTDADPLAAGADEVRHVTRDADTFDRIADDYSILTGV
ncbi:hypothetical protein [Ewingella americana]